MTSSYDAAILDSDPIAYWMLEEEEGSLVAGDSSGNGNNGDYAGGMVLRETGIAAGGKSVKCIAADASSYIEVPNSVADSVDHFHIVGWVKITDPTDTNYHYIARNYPGSGDGQGFALRVNNDGVPQFFASIDLTLVNISGGGDIRDGDWHQLVGTWNGSDFRLYVDGVQVSVATPSGSIDNATGSLFLGGFPGEMGDHHLDNVSLHLGDIESDVVLALYTLGITVPSSWGAIRNAVADLVSAIDGLQARPRTPLAINEDDMAIVEFLPGGIQPSGHGRVVEIYFRVVIVVNRSTVTESEEALDDYLWPRGAKSVILAVMADSTLGGIVDDTMWLNSGTPYGTPEGSPTGRQSEVQFKCIMDIGRTDTV